MVIGKRSSTYDWIDTVQACVDLAPGWLCAADAALPEIDLIDIFAGSENGETFDNSTFRQVLGHFASGIVIVTGSDASEPLGFTCQSFSAVSLDPPLVLICPSRTSVTWPRIRRSGSFGINILSSDQEMLSRIFAVSGGDKFESVSWERSQRGLPAITGCLAYIECNIERSYDGGDHHVVLGRVLSLKTHGPLAPLLFHRGTYGEFVPRLGIGA
jgi:3-hydroxy-9,10-secoandrosta-1,3,5(10)-triene-9,17-dione monooxygenase reductase component